MGKPGLLIVDDLTRNRQVLEARLRREGFVVHAVSTEREALQWLQSGEAPQAVISELDLPEGDGLSLCQQIKQVRAWRQIPFVLLTRERSRAKRLAANQSGCDLLLFKPLVVKEIVTRVEELLARWERPEAAPQPPEPADEPREADEAPGDTTAGEASAALLQPGDAQVDPASPGDLDPEGDRVASAPPGAAEAGAEQASPTTAVAAQPADPQQPVTGWLSPEEVLIANAAASPDEALSIPTAVYRIIGLCDGTRSAQQVIEAAGVDDARTKKILGRLLKEKMLQRVAPSSLLAPSAAPPAAVGTPTAAPAPAAASGRGWLVVLGALLLVGALGLAVWHSRRSTTAGVTAPLTAGDAALAARPGRDLSSASGPSHPEEEIVINLPQDAAVAPPRALATGVGNSYATLLTQAEEELRTPQRWEAMGRRQRKKIYTLLSEAVKVHPDGWQALQELSLIELKRGAIKRAITLARRAQKTNPGAPYTYLVIGSALHEQGKLKQAKAAYTHFLALCPRCRYTQEIRFILRNL